MAKTQKKSRKSSLALLLLMIAFVIIIGAALAFFSDMGATVFQGTAGTVEIEVDNTMTAVQYFTKEGVGDFKNPANLTNLNPGDYLLLTFGVKNVGSKSVWVKAELGDIMVTKAGESDATKDESGAFTLLAIPAADLAKIGTTYANINEYMLAVAEGIESLDPAGDSDAVALNGTVEDDDATSVSATLVYVLYFNKTAGNEYQEADVEVTIDVKAVQYRNNGTSTTADFTTVTSRIVP